MKYTTIFSSTIKPLVSEEKDKYLAMASLLEVADFVPNLDTDKNIDLLPIAFNACVVNRVNKNGDVIDTSTALEIYEGFVNKPINIEHNRQKIIGTILTAGYSEFGTDKPLTKEEAILQIKYHEEKTAPHIKKIIKKYMENKFNPVKRLENPTELLFWTGGQNRPCKFI